MDDEDGFELMNKVADITSGRKQMTNVNCNHNAVYTTFLYRAMFS